MVGTVHSYVSLPGGIENDMFLIGKSTISMAMFNSYVNVYQRVINHTLIIVSYFLHYLFHLRVIHTFVLGAQPLFFVFFKLRVT